MRPAVFALALLLASPALAVDFVVEVTTDGTDATPGDGACADAAGNCTLRAAIQEANATVAPDDVILPAGVYKLTLKRDTDLADDRTGDLDVTSEISVVGAGTARKCKGVDCTLIDGRRGRDRVFDVAEGGDLLLEDLIVKNGKAAKTDFNPTQSEEVSGGCIRVDGDLELEDVAVERCSSPDDGGCIGFTDASTGDLTDTVLDRCKAKDGGGGVEVDSGEVAMDRVTIANSKAGFDGGGIETSGGTLDLRNLTLSRNKAKMGGGLAAEFGADVSLNNATLFDNKAKAGASIFADEFSQFIGIAVSNSLLRTGGKELNCLGPIASSGGNLENGVTCPFDLPSDCSDCNPSIVKKLLDNGGDVPTHAINPDSEAINRGVATCEGTDARGAARVGNCDSGSFEWNGMP